MRFAEKGLEIAERAIAGVDVHLVGDVVTVVAQRGRAEWQ